MFQKDYFEFFKKDSMPASSNKSWAMLLYTIYQIFSLFTRKDVMKRLFISLAITAIVIGGFQWGSKTVAQEIQKNLYANRQKIVLIKEMDGAHIESVINYIKLTKEKNLQIIQDSYWSARYIHENERELKLARLGREMRELAYDTTNFYDEKAQVIMQAYSMIQKDKSSLIKNTSIYDDIIAWDNHAKLGLVTINKKVQKETADWTRNLVNPTAKDEYLLQHKKMIAETKIF